MQSVDIFMELPPCDLINKDFFCRESFIPFHLEHILPLQVLAATDADADEENVPSESSTLTSGKKVPYNFTSF